MRTPQNCGSCKWGKWQLTAKGNPKRTYGDCTFPFTPPTVVPDCYSSTYHKTHVWRDQGTSCPTWKAKP